jgi:ATP-dependent Clp protease ATP-binding subunit ClpA
VTEAAYDKIAKEGYNPQYGARPLRRLIQNELLTPIATMIISREIVDGSTVTVDVKKEKFVFEVKRPRGKKAAAEPVAEPVV